MDAEGDRFVRRESFNIAPTTIPCTTFSNRSLSSSNFGFSRRFSRVLQKNANSLKTFRAAFLVMATCLLASNAALSAQEMTVRSAERLEATLGRVRSFQSIAEDERKNSRMEPPLLIPPFNTVSEWTPNSDDVSAFQVGSVRIGKRNVPAPLPSPSPRTGFLAVEDNDRAIPPDTQGAVGPDSLVVTLNTQVRIQSRTGTALSTVSLNRFWTNLVDGVASTFDPRVHYDSQAGRWIMVTLANGQSTNSLILVAVSQTADPAGNWFGFELPGDSSKTRWADFPIIGLNSKWLVVSVSLYTVGTNKFDSTRLSVFDKNQAYSNGTVPVLAKTFDDKGGPVLAPSIDYDQSHPTIYCLNAINGNSSGKGFLRLSTLTGDVGAEVFNPGIATPAVTSTWAAFPNPQDIAQQLGTDKKIHNGDHRISTSVVLRNGSLWFSHGIFLPADVPTRSSVQWWELGLDGSVRQLGRIDDPSGKSFFAFPSLAVNKNNDLLIGYSRFSDTQFVSANYAFRAATDPLNTLRADTILKAGEASYFKTFGGTRNRWGDYSSTVVDPLNDLDLWTLQEYSSSKTNTWGTWWGRFGLDTSGVPPAINSFNPANGGVGTSVTIVGSKLTDTTAVAFNGVNAPQFTINSSSRLTAVVPLGATTGTIRVTTLDGTATSSTNFVVLPAPAISSLFPDRGGPGEIVVITGANLSGATSVKFNEVSAQVFTVVSPTQISATVPAAATTGRVSVSSPTGVGLSSGNFTVTLEPAIGSVTPNAGSAGGIVTIVGANFSSASQVRFNGVDAPQFKIESATRITVPIPSAAASGFVEVVTPNGTARSADPFAVVAEPVITDFNPKSGFVGASVTIAGANLADATAVKIGGVNDPTFTVDSSRQITARVPVGATNGLLTVTTAGGTASSVVEFVVIPPPANDLFVNAQAIAGTSGTISGSSVGATKESGEPDHAGSTGGRSIWYRWIAPTNGSWNFHTTGSKFDITLAVYSGTNVSQLTEIASNDDADSETVTSSLSFFAASGAAYSFAVAGFRDTAGDVILSWINTTAKPSIGSFSPTNGPVGSMVIVLGANFLGTAGVKFGNVTASDFVVESANRISVRVPVNAVTAPISVTTPSGATVSAGSFNVTPPVSNDNFANGQTLPGTSGNISGDNSGATFEIDEPKHANVNALKSVWFRWTAPSKGRWTFDTRGSAFDTLLAVYTGDTLAGLTEIASNDDAFGATSSALSFDAVPGTLYHIAVDGYATGTGSFVLNWTFTGDTPKILSFTPTRGDTGSSVVILGENFGTNSVVEFNGFKSTSAVVESSTRIVANVPASATTGPIRVTTTRGTVLSLAYFVVSNSDAPPNDLFSDARIVSDRAWIVAGRTTSASKEPDEPDHVEEIGGRSIWYRWVAPENGAFSLSTAGSSFDTLLAVYTGDNMTNLVFVAGSDDAEGGAASKVQFQAKAGVTYQIAVDGYGGESGSVILRLVPSAESKVIFSTGFETSEGYKLQQPLVGQQGWNKSGTGQDGIVSQVQFGAGQQAQLGGALTGKSVRTSVWQPVTNELPVMQFSVSMAISQSTNNESDSFDWSVFNADGQPLFTLDFDNFASLVSFGLDDGEGLHLTDVSFDNDQVYQLGIAMDFRNNTWSAFLDQVPIALEKPITTFGASLNLGYVDAVWLTDATPGDNSMIFDNYRIVAETNAPPEIFAQPQSQSVAQGTQAVFGAAVRGTEPLTYQWRFNGQIVSGATNAVLILNNVLPDQAGNYSVEAKNAFGGIVSESANLSVKASGGAFRFSAASLLPDGRFAGTLITAPGARYSIESSTNLIQWTEILSGVNTNGTLNFFDLPSASIPQRFFRARQQ